MNREIKFRAWDNENKYMITSKQGIFTALRNSMNITGQDNGYYNNGDLLKPNKEKYTLMQYTGLKDKNGVEIYEGDILETCENYGIGECWLKYEVKYNKELAQFILFPVIENGTYNNNNWDTPIYSYHEQAREIIGNIYENEVD